VKANGAAARAHSEREKATFRGVYHSGSHGRWKARIVVRPTNTMLRTKTLACACRVVGVASPLPRRHARTRLTGAAWRLLVQVNGRKIHLGTFSTSEEAARAWDRKALQCRGSGTMTNFDQRDYDSDTVRPARLLPPHSPLCPRCPHAHEAARSGRAPRLLQLGAVPQVWVRRGCRRTRFPLRRSAGATRRSCTHPLRALATVEMSSGARRGCPRPRHRRVRNGNGANMTASEWRSELPRGRPGKARTAATFFYLCVKLLPACSPFRSPLMGQVRAMDIKGRP
jgi:hypothetical protein